MEQQLLRDVVLILGLSVLMSVLFFRVRVPAIIAFIITGVIAGPHGLGLVGASHEVDQMAELGVIFLLFIIGIEFSLKGLSKIRHLVIWGGLIQVGGTILLTLGIGSLLEMDFVESLFMGFLLSLSSTAIVLKMLNDRGELHTPQGRIATAILIAQDIIVVPMMLVTPLLAGQSENLLSEAAILLARLAFVLIVVFLLSKYIVPFILRQVAGTRSRELFILSTVVMCFATAWFTSSMGLSLALGAFFAGLIISESHYSHQAMANIIPFREIFISFFFVSIGMLLDLNFFIANWWIVLSLTIGVAVLKSLASFLAGLIMRYPPRVTILASLSLFQVGEFAFVLSVTGLTYGLLQEGPYQYFLSVSILTMGLTPAIIAQSGRMADFLLRMPLPKEVRKRLKKRNVLAHEKQPDQLSGHLIIIGYGVNGEHLATAARISGIQHVVVELDPVAFEKCIQDGVPVVFGDASDTSILHHVQATKASVIVVAISDYAATRQILQAVRSLNTKAYLIARTRYIQDITGLHDAGADEVIIEELETSMEIFTRVLNHYLVPENDLDDFTSKIRTDNYAMLRRGYGGTAMQVAEGYIPDLQIRAIRMTRSAGKWVGNRVADVRFRSDHFVALLAIKRGQKFLTSLDDDLEIELDDILYVAGNRNQVDKFMAVSES